MAEMQEFQSSKTAEEIESVFVGALVPFGGSPLTESQQQQARDYIGTTAFGSGIKIFSHFDTLDELKATVQTPEPGQAYSVGVEPPYQLYVFDFLNDEWRDYGPIRAIDISARFAQNVAVDVNAWEEDTDVFADYFYKADIPLGEVTGNDFPIVAFSPSDAVGGNFCPIAYCFDSYVEIWAKAIPTEPINIPALTFIVQDDGTSRTSTKGITNAGGGIPTGGVNNDMLANGSVTAAKIAANAVSQSLTVTLAAASWSSKKQTVTANGVTASNTVIVSPAPASHLAYCEAGVRCVAQAANSLTFQCEDVPTVALTVNVTCINK